MGKIISSTNGRDVTGHRMYVVMSALEILKGTSFFFFFFLNYMLGFLHITATLYGWGCPYVRDVETKAKKDGHTDSKW